MFKLNNFNQVAQATDPAITTFLHSLSSGERRGKSLNHHCCAMEARNPNIEIRDNIKIQMTEFKKKYILKI
jgi:hypothetical protein